MNRQMDNQQRCRDTVLPLSAFTAEYSRRKWQGNKGKREVLAWKSGIRGSWLFIQEDCIQIDHYLTPDGNKEAADQLL